MREDEMKCKEIQRQQNVCGEIIYLITVYIHIYIYNGHKLIAQ